jgi:hypothetical protein
MLGSEAFPLLWPVAACVQSTYPLEMKDNLNEKFTSTTTCMYK